MKRSECVSLVVLGSAITLTGCQDAQSLDLQQQRYFSRQDCVRDWGDESQCSQSNGATTGGGGGDYYGPRYYWDRDINRPVVVSADGKTSVAGQSRVGSAGSSVGQSFHAGSISRGGFGGFARGFSLGG